jgi:hypothetical protein
VQVDVDPDRLHAAHWYSRFASRSWPNGKEVPMRLPSIQDASSPGPHAVALLLILLTTLAPSALWAQSQGDPLGRLYLSFAPDAEVRNAELEAMQSFELYLIAELDFTDIGDPDRNEQDGIKGWETCITIPPEVTVTNMEILRPGFNGADDSCDENWIMILDSCAFGEDMPVAFVRYEAVLTTAARNVELSLGPASPSSIDTNAPGWFVCAPRGEPGDIRPFEPDWSELTVINERVATDAFSWSAVKSLFDR